MLHVPLGRGGHVGPSSVCVKLTCVHVWCVVVVQVSQLRMMQKVLLVAATCCLIRSTGAFAPAGPMALGGSTRSSAHALSRKQFRPALPALRMVENQPNQVIDFGKVGFSDAENPVCTRHPPSTPCHRSSAHASARRPHSQAHTQWLSGWAWRRGVQVYFAQNTAQSLQLRHTQ